VVPATVALIVDSFHRVDERRRAMAGAGTTTISAPDGCQMSGGVPNVRTVRPPGPCDGSERSRLVRLSLRSKTPSFQI
jgi:hypothetical protein